MGNDSWLSRFFSWLRRIFGGSKKLPARPIRIVLEEKKAYLEQRSIDLEPQQRALTGNLVRLRAEYNRLDSQYQKESDDLIKSDLEILLGDLDRGIERDSELRWRIGIQIHISKDISHIIQVVLLEVGDQDLEKYCRELPDFEVLYQGDYRNDQFIATLDILLKRFDEMSGALGASFNSHYKEMRVGVQAHRTEIQDRMHRRRSTNSGSKLDENFSQAEEVETLLVKQKSQNRHL